FTRPSMCASSDSCEIVRSISAVLERSSVSSCPGKEGSTDLAMPTTLCPRLSSRSESARPIPLVAPVTRKVREDMVTLRVGGENARQNEACHRGHCPDELPMRLVLLRILGRHVPLR